MSQASEGHQRSRISSYRDLIVWQKGMELVCLTYKLTAGLPEEERYGLKKQMRNCSIRRDVAHEGWLPQQVQVGISGRTIAPKVYLAVGIRGAFNHTVGLQRAGVIISVNQNRRAVMFRSSDFGIVGTWEEFLPPLIEELRPILLELTTV